MPALVRQGPFSYDSNAYSATRTYNLVKAAFVADKGDILEVIINGVKIVGEGANAVGDEFTVNSVSNPTSITVVTTFTTTDPATSSALVFSSGTIIVKRLSNRATAVVDFAPGSVIREVDLDSSTNQTLHVAQEAMDIAFNGMVLEANDKFDGRSKVIENLADGVADNDAVNKAQLDVHDTTITGYQTTTNDYKLESKDWAHLITSQVKAYSGGSVTGSFLEDSAKNWASGITSAAPSAGSAKEWAIGGEGTVGTAVAGGEFSAKKHATDAAASETAVINVANTVSLVHDDLRDLYLGSGTTNKASADACTLTGAVWAKGKNLITGLTVASGAVTVGQKLTVDGGEDSTGFPTTTEVQILAWNSGTSTITINQIFSASNATTPDLTGAGLGLYAVYTNGPSTDNDGSTLIDGALYYDSTIDSLMVYDLGATTWLQIKPNTSQQANIDTVAGQITPTNNVATVAGKATEIGLLGALDTEIGLLGTGPMANSTDGDIKVVADLNTEVGLLGALDTEIGLLGTAGMAHATTGNLAKIGAGYDGTATQSGTTTNLAQINTVAAGLANVDNFANRYRVAANADLPLPDLDAGDLYFNTDTNELNVYDASTSSWSQATPNQGDIDAINIVAGNLVYQEDLGQITDAVTTSSGTSISNVAAMEAEIVRLGTTAMSTASTGHLARLGTADAVADMALLGLAPVIEDMAILGSTTVTDDMAILGSTTVTDDMAILGGSGVVGNIATVAGSIGNVNRYANEYVISDSSPTSPTPTAGDLWYDGINDVMKYHNGTAFSEITTGMTSLIADATPELGGTLESNNNNFTEVGTISGDNLQIDFGSIA